MEALASFGGSDLGSVVIKKRDLKEELKVEAEQLKSEDSVPQDSVKLPRTRYVCIYRNTFQSARNYVLLQKLGVQGQCCVSYFQGLLLTD